MPRARALRPPSLYSSATESSGSTALAGASARRFNFNSSRVLPLAVIARYACGADSTRRRPRIRRALHAVRTVRLSMRDIRHAGRRPLSKSFLAKLLPERLVQGLLPAASANSIRPKTRFAQSSSFPPLAGKAYSCPSREMDWQFLRQLGCDLAQGYFVAKPMPGKALLGWATKWEERSRYLRMVVAAT